MFLVYRGDIKQELRVSCYADAGYLTDPDDLKSQTGYVYVVVLLIGRVPSKDFATSSTEAEYIAAFDASNEALWVRKFISRIGVVPTIEECISMYCDNIKAITIANESGITRGARHFWAKVHYLRKVIEYGDVKLEKVHTNDNLADPFTKALAFPSIQNILRILKCFQLVVSYEGEELEGADAEELFMAIRELTRTCRHEDDFVTTYHYEGEELEGADAEELFMAIRELT
nr:hypothetical protein [Tanacetum cinerariifolium]